MMSSLFSFRKLSAFLGVSAMLGFGSSSQAQTGTLIAGWHFNTFVAGNPIINSNFGTGTIYVDGTNGSDIWPSGNSGYNTVSGTNLNTTGFPVTVFAVNALRLIGSPNNGKSVVMKFSMTGYTDLQVSFASKCSSTGFDMGTWSYSTDGIAWTGIAGNTAIRSNDYAIENVPTITGLNHAPEAYLRYTLSGATGGLGSTSIDNIQIRATSTPLAITIGTFHIANKGNNNLLEWNSVTEEIGDKFEIERSINGYHFEKIATINASGKADKYSYIDETPKPEINYYRLNLVNIDGMHTYSKIISATVKKSNFELQFYPNPAKDQITIATKGAESAAAHIYVSDIAGKVLFQKSAHTEVVNVDISTYPTGLYLLNYNDGSHKETFKFTKGN